MNNYLRLATFIKLPRWGRFVCKRRPCSAQAMVEQ